MPWKLKLAHRSFSEVGSTPTAAKAMVGRPGRGDPQTVIVGLPDAAVKESKDRVNTAILNSRLRSKATPRHAGFEMPKDRLTINLAPADIKKEGPIFDLPIAMGVLATMGDIPMEALGQFSLVGELALSGEVRRARGVLPITMAMRAKKRPAILVPYDNADEAAVVEGIDVYPVRNLHEAVDIIAGRLAAKPYHIDVANVFETHFFAYLENPLLTAYLLLEFCTERIKYS